ncbi:hypothetical protein SAMN05421780_11028 [Flexibacter flexilis DSM 6793]|uniref:Uncharacterized protein n=1 Tax=Flexibacter flexilis DSM 6793 TaxID=927664 RepID=A0A1I1M4L9_9BACT|nr:hypothetical protein [Flexibacter flexilis]SFC80304.1 hypothetical protein SAMN05421780_11028 [Flexibacter flexilis DSM 6793]
MKKVLLAILLAVGFIGQVHAQNPKAEAVANKINGFFIFTDSQPLAEYEAVGEIATTGHNDRDIKNSGAQYQAVRDYIIREARKVNYTADGLMFQLVNGGTDKAIIIKFKESVPNAEKSKARVTQFQGVYTFVDCEPTAATDYLGTVKTSFSLGSAQYTKCRDKLLKKAKKEYPNAEGLVIKFNAGGSDTGDAVKFK